MKPFPINTTVDRPCDIHFMEAWAMEKTEVVHCKQWDNVKKHVRHGILTMDCPQPGCCPTAQDINEKCRLGQYGASLYASPEHGKDAAQ
jgi:hypothetical protein